MWFQNLQRRAADFFTSERGKKILKWTQRFFNVGVLAWLVYQLTTIGWLKVWRSLPGQPLFYLLFAVLFFQLPLFEVFIYRLIWKFDTLRSIPIFLLKRVYNKDVLGYSGEIYFFAWAKTTLHVTGREVLKIIKDNNIISAVASTLVSIGLLSIFLFTDQIKFIQWIANQNQTYFIGGVLVLVIIVFLFVKFRHNVISMPLKKAYQIFGMQMLRLLFVQVVNLLMYYVVFPEVPFYIWFTYIALEIIISRIPFLPNGDFVFAAMSIALAGRLSVSKEDIAGIMIAKSVLNKIGSVFAFSLASLFKQSDIVPDPEKEGFEMMQEQTAEEKNSA